MNDSSCRRWLARAALGTLLLAGGSSCTTVGRVADPIQDPADRTVGEAPSLYLQGLRQLEKNQSAQAFTSFEKFLQQQPTSRYTQVALFNGARALEELERWKEAADRYRAVIKNTKHAPKLRALALYRLSYCLEALGDNAQTVAVLVDAQNRVDDLPSEIAGAELPARLAASYARVGSIEEAMRHYSRAEAGISRLKSQAAGRDLPAWLPRTLFQMGRISLTGVSWNEFEASLRPVEKAQLYLLQAAELNAGEWSEKAADELVRTYNVIHKSLAEKPEASSDVDPVEHERSVQNRRLEMAEMVLHLMRELRAARHPESELSQSVDGLFERLDQVEKSFLAFFDEAPAGSGLTPEAVARKERVRGRVVSPSDVLERDYQLQRSGERDGQMQRLPAEEGSLSEPEDPNL